MSQLFDRRGFLISGLGAAGCLLGQHSAPLDAAEPLPGGRRSKDLSANAPSLPVAIQRCESYEPQMLRSRLDAAFQLVGGIKKLVQGKTVTVKINVTGGPGTLGGLPGWRTYHVHPNLLAALCAALCDAGAQRIVVVESQYSPKSPEEVLGSGGWDIAAIKSAGGHKVTFEDTRNRGAWPRYSQLTVPWGGFLFPAFLVNQRYEKTDVLVSLAKMKDHLSAGVTLSVKNLFGMPPTSLYGQDAPNENTTGYRGAILHNGKRPVPAGVPAELPPGKGVRNLLCEAPGTDRGLVGPFRQKVPDTFSVQEVAPHWKHRVPRAIADLLGARPIDLAVIDGIEANRGGEGPWAHGVEPLQPRLLAVGRNPVCTDAICTAAMGYDPQAAHYQFPFPGENHLALLASVGVGTIDPQRIEVRGLPLDKAIFPFNPRHLPLDEPTAIYDRAHAFVERV